MCPGLASNQGSIQKGYHSISSISLCRTNFCWLKSAKWGGGLRGRYKFHLWPPGKFDWHHRKHLVPTTKVKLDRRTMGKEIPMRNFASLAPQNLVISRWTETREKVIWSLEIQTLSEKHTPEFAPAFPRNHGNDSDYMALAWPLYGQSMCECFRVTGQVGALVCYRNEKKKVSKSPVNLVARKVYRTGIGKSQWKLFQL